MKKTISLFVLGLFVLVGFGRFDLGARDRDWEEEEYPYPVFPTETYEDTRRNLLHFVYITPTGERKDLTVDRRWEKDRPFEVDITIVKRDIEGFTVSANASPPRPDYTYRWVISQSNSSRAFTGTGIEARFNTGGGTYRIELDVMRGQRIGGAATTVIVSDASVLTKYTVNSDINKNGTRQVTVSSSLSPPPPQPALEYRFSIGGEVLTRNTGSASYELKPGTYELTASITTSNGKVFTSEPKTITVNELPDPRLSMWCVDGAFDAATMKRAVTLSTSFNRPDLAENRLHGWNIAGEYEAGVGASITKNLAPGTYTVTVEFAGQKVTDSITGALPGLTIFSTKGEFEETGQAVAIETQLNNTINSRAEFFSFIIVSEDGNVVSRDGKALQFRSNKATVVLSPGNYTVKASYTDNTGLVLVEREKSITIETPPLEVIFKAGLRGRSKPNGPDEPLSWEILYAGPGIADIIRPIQEQLPGSVTLDIELTTERIKGTMSGTLAKGIYTGTIQGSLSGNIDYDPIAKTLKGTMDGSIVILFTGGEIDQRKVRIPLRVPVDFQIVKLNGDGLDLDLDLELVISGKGREDNGSLPDPGSDQQVKSEPKPAAVSQPKPVRPQPEPPKPASSISIPLNWNEGFLYYKKIGRNDVERVVIYKDVKTGFVTRIVLYVYWSAVETNPSKFPDFNNSVNNNAIEIFPSRLPAPRRR